MKNTAFTTPDIGAASIAGLREQVMGNRFLLIVLISRANIVAANAVQAYPATLKRYEYQLAHCSLKVKEIFDIVVISNMINPGCKGSSEQFEAWLTHGSLRHREVLVKTEAEGTIEECMFSLIRITSSEIKRVTGEGVATTS